MIFSSAVADELSFSTFDFLSNLFVLPWLFSGFTLERFIISLSVVADGKPFSLPIVALNFWPHVVVSLTREAVASHRCGCEKPFPSGHLSHLKLAIAEDRTLYYSTVAAVEVISLPMFSRLFSDSDPYVADGDILTIPPLRIK